MLFIKEENSVIPWFKSLRLTKKQGTQSGKAGEKEENNSHAEYRPWENNAFKKMRKLEL